MQRKLTDNWNSAIYLLPQLEEEYNYINMIMDV